MQPPARPTWKGRPPSAHGIDSHDDLLACVAEISVFDPSLRHEFLEGLELVPLPVRIVEVLVEQDDCAGNESVTQQVEDRSSRAIEIAIDVNESNGSGIRGEPWRQAVVKPAPMKLDVGR